MVERKNVRQYLKRGVVGAGLLIGSISSACNDVPSNDSVTITPITNQTRVESEALKSSFSAGSTTRESTQDIYPPEISLAYPKLAESGLIPKRVVEIRDRGNTYSRIYNYTDLNIDPESAMEMYRYFDEVFKDQLIFKGFQIDGQNRDVVAGRMQIFNRYIMFVPENTDIASQEFTDSGLDMSKIQAATAVNFNKRVTYSYIKTSDDPQIARTDATLSLATEICQSMIASYILDSAGKITGDDRLNSITQEIICNSLGFALAARSLGISHDSYIDYLSQQKILGSNPIKLRSNQYDAIPQINPIIKTAE